MPKTVAKLEDFEVLLTIGTGSFGTCRKVRRKVDGKVCSCIGTVSRGKLGGAWEEAQGKG